MECRVINEIPVTVAGEITDGELALYLQQLQSKKRHKIIKADISVNGEYIDVNYKLGVVPFERIRRITGYLVGTTERWNNAKQSELKDRTKHC